jgi:hypothetical protein
MRKASYVAFAAALAAIAYFVFFAQNDRGITIAPVPGQAMPRNPSSELNASAVPGESPSDMSVVVRIPLQASEVVLRAFDINLDDDEMLEQVYLVRNSSAEDGLIRFVIADQSESTGAFQRVFEDSIDGISVATSSIVVKDFTGDKLLDIGCYGLDESGSTTFSLFARRADAASYATALRIVADGSIIADEPKRPEASVSGQASSGSARILSYSQKTGSTNIFDQIETSWDWNPSRFEYEKGEEKAISGSALLSQRLSDIQSKGEGGFESFLMGLWYKSDGGLPGAYDARILSFDPMEKTVSFFFEGTEEKYVYNSARATKYGLYLSSSNQIVPSLTRNIDIELASVDSIRVTIYERINFNLNVSDKWHGVYKKLSRSASNELEKGAMRTGALAAGQLEGEYLSSNGLRYRFEGGEYSIQSYSSQSSPISEKAHDERGQYSLLIEGEAEYLRMRATSMKGKGADSRKSYLVQRSGGEGNPVIILKPAAFSIMGPAEVIGQAIMLYPAP